MDLGNIWDSGIEVMLSDHDSTGLTEVSWKQDSRDISYGESSDEGIMLQNSFGWESLSLLDNDASILKDTWVPDVKKRSDSVADNRHNTGHQVDNDASILKDAWVPNIKKRSVNVVDNRHNMRPLKESSGRRKSMTFCEKVERRNSYRQPVVTNYMRCDEHLLSSGRMALFCEQCNIPMCFDCRSAYHMGHKYTTIDGAAIKRKLSVTRTGKKLQHKCEDLQNLKRKLAQYNDELNSKYDSLEQQINDRTKNLHKLVDQWHGKTMMQMDSIWKQERALVKFRMDEIEATLAEMEETSDHIDTLLFCNSANDFLSLSEDVDAQLQDLGQREISGLEDRVCAIFTNSVELTPDMFGSLFIERLQNDSAALHYITQGKELVSFDSRPKNAACEYSASGLSITPSGDIIVTDIGLDMAQVFTPFGSRLVTFNTLPNDHPTKAIMVSSNRAVIACRTGLKLFGANGEFLNRIRDAECPSGMALSCAGDLMVSDVVSDGCILQVYENSELKLVNTVIGSCTGPCVDQPWYLAIDSENDIIVADYHEHCVKIFSAFGGLHHEFGGKGCKPGQFFHPAGICIDKLGHILVADSFNDRVQLFTKSGEFLGVILNGMDDTLVNPIDLAINHEDHLVVLQGDGQVRTFQYIC